MTLTPRSAGPGATTPGDRCWLESKSARDDVTTLESDYVSRFTNRDKSWKHQDGHRVRVSLRRHARGRDDGV